MKTKHERQTINQKHVSEQRVAQAGRKRTRLLLASLLWPLPGLAAFFLQRLLAAQPALTEKWHAQRIFRLLAVPISFITSWFPFSLTELLTVLALPLLVLFIVLVIKKARQKNKQGLRRQYLTSLVRKLAWALSLLYLVFMLLHGFNYARQPIAVSFDLPVRQRGSEELAETAAWLIEQINVIRPQLNENEQGVFAFTEPVRKKIAAADQGFHQAAADYPLLAGHAVRAKPVLLSHYWSYTGITGMYFPFLVEANVNIDTPHYQVLDTAMHEIAHLRGFAREDEANFLAFLTGIYHPDPDFRYAAMLSTTNRCLNALYRYDRERHSQLLADLYDGARRDLQAASAYWRQFEGPVREASTTVNHAYLQANLQEDGVRSYGRMVDLALAWYEKQAALNQLGHFAAVSE